MENKNRAVASKDQQIAEMLGNPTVVALGYQLWGVEYICHRAGTVLVRVFIDSPATA